MLAGILICRSFLIKGFIDLFCNKRSKNLKNLSANQRENINMFSRMFNTIFSFGAVGIASVSLFMHTQDEQSTKVNSLESNLAILEKELELLDRLLSVEGDKLVEQPVSNQKSLRKPTNASCLTQELDL